MIVTVNNITVAYEQLGSGPDLIVLHGWGYDHTLLLPFAQQLGTFARVTLIDLPGHGGTQEPPVPYDAFDFADTVAGVMDALGIQKAAMLGHSNGGRTILAMTRDHADRMSRLILCDAAGLKPKRTFTYYRKVYTYKIGKAFLKLPFFSEETRQRYSSGKGSEDYKNLSPVMKQTFIRLVNKDLSELLASIRVPVLLIWGDQDQDTPLYMAHKLEKEIPDCGLVLYEGAGHYAFVERMAQTAAVVRSFLSSGRQGE